MLNFFRRNRKTALRTPDNYNDEQMMSDHEASVSEFYEATGAEPVAPGEEETDG